MSSKDEGEIARVRSEVLVAAKALVKREVPFLEGVRRLDQLRFEVSDNPHDSDFIVFVAIASQADHIPNKEVRDLCTKSWLAQCDKDESELEAVYEQNVRASCEHLIKRFASEA